MLRIGMKWLFGRPGAARAPVLIAFLVLINALILRVSDPPALARLRDFAFDHFQRLQPRVVVDNLPVHIVDIDEASLREYGQWPWPRNLLAKLVDKLAEKGVAVIAFDAVFAEPDRSSLNVLAQSLPEEVRNTDMRRMMEALPSNDEVFSEAIAQSTVVTGFAFDLNGTREPPRRMYGVAHNSGEKDTRSVRDLVDEFIPQQQGAVRTIDVLEGSAKGNGAVTTEVEGAVVRTIPMLFRLVGQRDEDLYPALAAEAIRVAQGASTYLVRWSGAQGLESFGARTGVGSIRVGRVNIDTDARGRVVLYDSGHLPSRFISARDVLADAVPADKLEGNIIFVGTSAVGLKDLRNTPIQDSVPGVEIHAQIIEQLLTQTFLERPDYANGLEFLYLAAIGLAFVLLLPRLTARNMALVAAMFVGIGVAVPWFAFTQWRLLFDPIYPPATLAAIYVGGSALAFMRAERDRREIRGAFNLYLPPERVEEIVRNPKLLELGGETRELTIMFTDMRGFTTISEQFDPQGLTRFMNRFLTPMTDIILSRRGTIDKYMADAIMAFWNAPLDVEGHAALACDAALAMQAQIVVLNKELEAEAAAAGRKHITVNFGIGLNTGRASVGNFGSTQRFTYSCIGDEVNLASRLEGQCKEYVVNMVIGENTRQHAPDFAAVELDLIMVKGKTEPARMYSLVGDTAMAKSDNYIDLIKQQDAFLDAYRAGRFKEAGCMIDACVSAANSLGWRQGYYDMMRKRVSELIEDPPANWIGVHVAKTK